MSFLRQMILLAGATGASAAALMAVTPGVCECAWQAVANAVTFGWHQRIEQRLKQRHRRRLCEHRHAVAVEDLNGDGQLPAALSAPTYSRLFLDPDLISDTRRKR